MANDGIEVEVKSVDALMAAVGLRGSQVLFGDLAVTPDEAEALAKRLRQYAKLARGQNVKSV